MSWYSTNYKQRIPIAIKLEYVGGVPPAATATKDISITVPSNFDPFWTNIRSDAFDAILVSHDNNLLTFKRASFNYANRQLTFEVDAFVYDNKENSTGLIFLYWNYSSATDLASVFTASSPMQASIFLGTPRGRLVMGDPTGNNTSNSPSATVQKSVDENVYVWFQYSTLLNRMKAPYNNRVFFESIKQVNVFSFDSTGTDSSGRFDALETVFSSGYIGIMAKGGTNNTTYLLGAFITTSLFQEIQVKCYLEVSNKYPPS